MAKICPSCRRRPSDYRQIACEQCKTALVDERDIVARLTNDELAVVAGSIWGNWRTRWKFYFLWAILFLVVSTGLDWLIRSTIDSRFNAAKENAEAKAREAFQVMTQRIAQAFEGTNVQKTVTEVAAKYATNTMAALIKPEVAKFKRDLEASQAQAQADITDIQRVLDVTILITAARADDRFAFVALTRLTEGGPKVAMQYPFHDGYGLEDEKGKPLAFVLRDVVAKTIGQIESQLQAERASAEKLPAKFEVWADLQRMRVDVENGRKHGIHFGLPPSLPNEGTTRTNATIQDYERLLSYYDFDPSKKVCVVRALFSEQRFSLVQRLDALARILEKDRSLKCVYCSAARTSLKWESKCCTID